MVVVVAAAAAARVAATTATAEPVIATVRRVWSLLGGAALVLSLAALTGCSDEGAAPSSSDAVSTSSVPVSTTGPSVASTAAPTTVAANPGVLLQDVLADLAAGYHFTSTVTVNGVQSVVADGDRIGDASRLTITGSNATVAYVITAGGSYVKPEDGDWERLDVSPATSDPITALSSPSGIAPLPTSDGSVQVRVTVAATALGIAAEGSVEVDVTLVDGAVAQVTYTAAIEGGTAMVVTVIGPVADASPIVPPI